MSRKVVLAAILAAAFQLSNAQSGCQQIDGNYYCSQTNAISFNNIGFSGSYNQITNMDSTSCSCSSSPVSFSGPLAPLNDEVSIFYC